MNRRTFLRNTAQAACWLKLIPGSLRAQQSASLSPTLDLYRNCIVIDALAGMNSEEFPLRPEITRQAVDSGVTAINWTVSRVDYEGTVDSIAKVNSLVDGDPSHWLFVHRQSDFDRAKREQKIGIILGFQHPEAFESDLKRLLVFARLGVRVMQLTYNNRSLLGDGCLEPANAGLSRLGREAITAMNELGVAVDFSHSGQRTTAEGIEASAKPSLITHAGCNAIHPHPRNKDDRELRALADRGGVVGIYLMPYLVASPISPTTEDVLLHLDHALKVCGSDHVGIGSDGTLDTFPASPEQRMAFLKDMETRKRQGIAAPEEDRAPMVPELNVPRRFEILAAGLNKRGYSADIIERVLGRNFYRAFGEIWKTA